LWGTPTSSAGSTAAESGTANVSLRGKSAQSSGTDISAHGFISIERFESLYEPGKILSLSFFRDEAAVQAWRTTNEHRVAQAKGRGEIFSNYRLRVAGVIRDYGMREREQAPDDSRKIHRV
jgi:heme-degrading monooxygenase HmoA